MRRFLPTLDCYNPTHLLNLLIRSLDPGLCLDDLEHDILSEVFFLDLNHFITDRAVVEQVEYVDFEDLGVGELL